MTIQHDLLHKLEDKTALVGIIGLGYVGVPLMLRFHEVGMRVLGIDVDVEKVASLNAGKSSIATIPSGAIAKAVNSGFVATTDFAATADADALIICVPTPLNKYREPDLSYVTGTMDALQPHLRNGHVIALESTTYPGTTDEELRPRIQGRGFEVGKNLFLIYSPEREDPGNATFSTRTIPKIVGGCTPACLEVGVALYRNVIDQVVPVSSTKTAEMVKLLENIHRAVNIGLVNEMKIVADKMGIDIHEVIRAASTKPFGFTPYYPGPGLGGHCIPIDPFYLTWKAREYGINTRFIELAGEVNRNMPEWVMQKVSDAFNARRKSINGSRVLILGIAYKKNVDDMRESPAVELMDLLQKRGAEVDYSDPWVPTYLPRHGTTSGTLASVELTPQRVAAYDCVLLATNHDLFDYAMLKANARLIVDTRGVYLDQGENIVKA
jgi:UDP-N-acetyl-D-glucosamine dehydrogenase